MKSLCRLIPVLIAGAVLVSCAHHPAAPTAVTESAQSGASSSDMVVLRLNPYYGGFYFSLPADWAERRSQNIREGGRSFITDNAMPGGVPASIAVIPLENSMPPVENVKHCAEMSADMSTRLKVQSSEFRKFASGDFCEVTYREGYSEFKLVILRANKNQFSALLAHVPADKHSERIFHQMIDSWGQVKPPR